MTVCKRRGTAGGWIGFAMVIGGIGIAGLDGLLNQFSWSRMGMLLVICGSIVVAYTKLKARTAANAETYRLGFDMGYEAGYQERDKTASRPVLVDLAARRAEALTRN
jgi:hypothetical protein